MKSEIKKVIQELGWTVEDCEDYWLIRNNSPAGEDLPLECPKHYDIVSFLEHEANMFDADDHAEEWLRRREEDGVPWSIRELINDADAIQEMYTVLANAVRKAREENEDS